VNEPITAIAGPEQVALPSPAGFAGSAGAVEPSSTFPVESSSESKAIRKVPGSPGLTVGLDSLVVASSVGGAALDEVVSCPDVDVVHAASRMTPAPASAAHFRQVWASKLDLRTMYSPK
jgi:hypothetical protein